MKKSLQLGSQLFSSSIIQGPLAGVSCAPFRRLIWRYSKPAFTCTEMISSKTLIHHSKEAMQRFTQKAPDEGPVCFQLSANNPKELGLATQLATEAGANLIDLNCGCPVKKIRSKGAGSSLLSDASKLYRMIEAMRQNTHLPISIKIRVEGGTGDVFNHEIAKVVNDARPDFLIVHGRHWTQHYETPVNHNEIAFFVREVKVPVIGNGDIRCKTSLAEMVNTGCAGVMIARAGVGQPWLIGELMEEIDSPPASNEIGEVFIEHVESLSTLLQSDSFAVLQARKLGKYYARHLPNKTEFCTALNATSTLQDFSSICRQYFI